MNTINEAAMIIMMSLMTQFASDNRMEIDPQELWCLSQNIYMEARAESYSGKQAVANVTRNRVNSPLRPNSYCAVVQEGPVRESWRTKQDPLLPDHERVYIPRLHRCQFSWWCDGEKDTIWVQYQNGVVIDANMNAWRDSIHIALATISNQLHDNTQGATHYYAHAIVFPHWARVYEITEVIGNHTFMRPPTK
jgi:spore germination cell wall hydrolase CwlJ-like protein